MHWQNCGPICTLHGQELCLLSCTAFGHQKNWHGSTWNTVARCCWLVRLGRQSHRKAPHELKRGRECHPNLHNDWFAPGLWLSHQIHEKNHWKGQTGQGSWSTEQCSLHWLHAYDCNLPESSSVRLSHPPMPSRDSYAKDKECGFVRSHTGRLLHHGSDPAAQVKDNYNMSCNASDWPELVGAQVQ